MRSVPYNGDSRKDVLEILINGRRLAGDGVPLLSDTVPDWHYLLLVTRFISTARRLLTS